MCSIADQLTQFILRKQIGFTIGQSMAILLDLDVVGVSPIVYAQFTR